MSNMRPYQQALIDEIRALIAAGETRILVKAPTGSGKTHVFSHILTQAASKGNPCAMIVRGRQLVDQASRRLIKEGVTHGVRMASHWNQNHSAKIQICSIDTLMARDEAPAARILVLDEAHLFTSEACKEYLRRYSNSILLSFTATPWCKESMEHLGNVVVQSVSLDELFNQGYLVPPRYYAPSTPDLKGVRTQAGDYVTSQLEDRMSVLTGDLPAHWLKFAEGRPTIAFAVNIKHSLSIVEQFNEAGIPAEHIEASHTFQEREAAIERLKTGRTMVLSNVGILCTGVDIPFVSCILQARPTQSYNLYVQQIGRGTRPHLETGKRDFILLDHAGNTLRHGFITDEPEVILQGIPKGERAPKVTMCERCFVIFGGLQCHVCGWSRPVVPEADRKEIELEEGDLKMMEKIPEWFQAKIDFKRYKDIARRKGRILDII